MKKLNFFDNSNQTTEMDKVMENIAQVEGEIQQRIFQLGQMVYGDNKDNPDINEKYFTMVDLIGKLEQNRRGFYKNKLRLEGQMMCENCGSIISYGSIFCSICGKKADEKQPDGEVDVSVESIELKCKTCGKALEEGSLFCTSCGTKVE